MRKAEENIQLALARYIRYQYPDVIFRSDAGGIKLTAGQARKMAALNGNLRGYPDMFIAKPKIRAMKDGHVFVHGLFIELKKEGTRILKRDGSLLADEHIREQAKMLQALERRGYEAKFAVGFEQAKQIVDEYIGRKQTDEDVF